MVIWDSHPLALGATPAQVYIDGIAQFTTPKVVTKPKAFQVVPAVPNFDKEAKAAVESEGLPPLTPSSHAGVVTFTNFTQIWAQDGSGLLTPRSMTAGAMAVVKSGKIICSGSKELCGSHLTVEESPVINLQGGVLAPGLIAFGSPLGLEEISAEASTNDGVAPDGLSKSVSSLAGGSEVLVRASDGLQFGGRSALYVCFLTSWSQFAKLYLPQRLAYMSGVTAAVSAPVSYGFIAGLGAAFSLGASHRLERGAVIEEITSLHVAIGHGGGVSVGTLIGTLRRGLLGEIAGESGIWFKKAAEVRPLLTLAVASYRSGRNPVGHPGLERGYYGFHIRPQKGG